MTDFYQKLSTLSAEANLFINEPMKLHTTFQVGGPADYYICPETKEEIIAILSLCKKEGIPFYVMGNGSNLLVGDGGYRGVIINTYEHFNNIQVKGFSITASAGASLSRIAHQAMKHSLSGFAFASGIPGSLGGACIMNAGAYGGEIGQVLTSVVALDESLNAVTFSRDDMELGYRTSIFAKKALTVLEATIHLKPGDKHVIKEEMDALTNQRKEKQPLEFPSAGSTFKRPQGYFAGKLIGDSGLSGTSIGGAMISPKHNGFVINTGNASSRDIISLIDLVIETVKDKFGVEMEPEIKRLGDFKEKEM